LKIKNDDQIEFLLIKSGSGMKSSLTKVKEIE
jgi:hypothetical protein